MGILGAIEILGKVNNGKSDYETQILVRKTIDAMEQRNRQEWPSKELRKVVNQMDNLQRKYFLDTLKDMDQALTDHYGDLL